MARPKKSAEMEVVFNNLKSATFEELQQVKEKCEALMATKKAEAIKAKEAQIEALKAELAELKK